MLTINDLAMHYGNKILFADVSLNLNKNNRYGLVGANGAGKSTLFKILANIEEPSLGEINIKKHSTIGWLRQDQFDLDDELIINAVIAGDNKLWQAIKEKNQLMIKDNFSEDDGFKLAELEEKIALLDGYSAESRAGLILSGLGIEEEKHYQKLSVLSGGFKLRVLLGQSLFADPDVLLLDEPTNHLDIFSITWLENYLKSKYSGLLIFISHDENFLNNLSTHILDLDYHEVRLYTGNYQQFLKEKALQEELIQKNLDSYEKRVANLQNFIDKYKAKASKAKQAKSKEKMIDKMEVPEIKKTTRIMPNFIFSQNRPSGKFIIKVKNIKKSFSEKLVLNKVNFTVNRGEKLAIIGKNGMGKSTLLKIILGHLQPDEGEYKWGHEANISYFSQDHHDLLNKDISILEWLTNEASSYSTSSEIRNALGKMLFTKDDVNKNILSISGGEAARLLFANIILKKANILILDEPTNHMDIETIEALAMALKNFKGTVIFVSHNRYFINIVAERIIMLAKNGIENFAGSFEDFLKTENQEFSQ